MQSVLNEGSFLDAISDTAKSLASDAMSVRDKNKDTYMRGSVSRYTKKLIMSFPTMCDNTIPISTMQMISKAHEKNIVSMFEMLFSAMSLKGTNGVDIIEALHKDLGSSSSIDDIIDAIEKSVGVNKESVIPSKAVLRDIIEEMCYDLKYNQKSLPVDSFSEHSLNDYIVRDIYGTTTVLEDTNHINRVEKVQALDESFDEEDLDILGEAGKDNSKPSDDYNKGYEQGKRDQADSAKTLLDYGRNRREQEDQDGGQTRDSWGRLTGELTGKEKQRREERSEDQEREDKREGRARAERIAKDRKDRAEKEKDRAEDRKDRLEKEEREQDIRLAQVRVKDSDYKKANEAQPTLVTIVYSDIATNRDKSGIEVVGRKSFVAGIKSRLVGCDAMEIVERLTATAKSKMTFKDLIRATTGEISLVKDFLLAIKQTKLNAKNASKRGETAKMWNLLAARSKKNIVSGYGLKSNEAAAITTLVINQETVNYIANNYKINIDNAKMASYIMENYNLLCLVIADEANEVAKFLYDGNNSFEMVAYSSLSRDMRDKDYNNTINLINKAGR